MSFSTGQASAKPSQSNGQSQGLEKEAVRRVITKKSKAENSLLDSNPSNSGDPKSAPGKLVEDQPKDIDQYQEEGSSQQTPIIKLEKDFNPNNFDHASEDGEINEASMSKEEPFANTYGKKRTYKTILADSQKRLKLANATYR
ncbi:hypothetical protein O181_047298 [Austropuccinia psidii MF-1]|uniref:Uncharacterized protein n=1 Tax=Austropuccinia psidii MF-1 TaxID=1389203 RepID=A0A9Q3DVR5_9BASI|nr:hypothetical protein [Austropuccinia psidii MF-1]